MSRTVLLAAVAALLCGCHSLRDVTAHKIGCPPHDVVISEQTTGIHNTTWLATCHDKQYECTGVWSGDEPANVECTPAS
jgi:hypothetical protein